MLVPAYQEKLKLDPSKLQHLQELSYYLIDEGKAWVLALRGSQDYAQEPEPNEEEEIILDPEIMQDQDLLDYYPNTEPSSS